MGGVPKLRPTYIGSMLLRSFVNRIPDNNGIQKLTI